MGTRFDTTEAKFVRNDKGMYNIDFTAMKPGVFPYYDWYLGRIVYELKHVDDWCTEDTAGQLRQTPITNDHHGILDASEIKQYISGLVESGAVSTDKQGLDGSGVIFDTNLIGAIEMGKQQCSLGFTCDVIDEIGVYDGKQYERRQINPKINHLAIVDEGRCGPEASIKMDSKEGAIQVRLDEIDKYIKIGGSQMKKVTIGGKEYEVEDAIAAELDSRQAKLDQAVDEVKGLKTTIETTKQDTAGIEGKIQQGVKDILGTYEDAKEFLPENYKLDGKTPRDIKADAIKNVVPTFDAKDKSDDYISARYDGMKDMRAVTIDGKEDGKDNKQDKTGIEAAKAARKNMFQGGK